MRGGRGGLFIYRVQLYQSHAWLRVCNCSLNTQKTGGFAEEKASQAGLLCSFQISSLPVQRGGARQLKTPSGNGNCAEYRKDVGGKQSEHEWGKEIYHTRGVKNHKMHRRRLHWHVSLRSSVFIFMRFHLDSLPSVVKLKCGFLLPCTHAVPTGFSLHFNIQKPSECFQLPGAIHTHKA